MSTPKHRDPRRGRCDVAKNWIEFGMTYKNTSHRLVLLLKKRKHEPSFIRGSSTQDCYLDVRDHTKKDYHSNCFCQNSTGDRCKTHTHPVIASECLSLSEAISLLFKKQRLPRRSVITSSSSRQSRTRRNDASASFATASTGLLLPEPVEGIGLTERLKTD